MDFAQLIIVAILVEAIWENIKIIYDKDKFNISRIGSLVLGIIFCVVFKIDTFPIIGLTAAIPFVGSVFTGIIVSRGANVVNDLVGKLKGE